MKKIALGSNKIYHTKMWWQRKLSKKKKKHVLVILPSNINHDKNVGKTLFSLNDEE